MAANAIKVIFLDVDGVLNNVESFRRCTAAGGSTVGEFGFDSASVAAVKRALDVTKARICLSSTWREGDGFERTRGCFERVGLPCPKWRTPVLREAPIGERRGHEIKRWLDTLRPVAVDYVIVDDDSDMLPEQFPYFVQTDFMGGGFTEAHADRVIELLS